MDAQEYLPLFWCKLCVDMSIRTEVTEIKPKKIGYGCRLAPTWQYFGTITCDGLHGIMKLYIDKP